MVKRKSKDDLQTPGMSDGSGNTGSSPSTGAPATLGSAPTPQEAEVAVKKKNVAQPTLPAERKPSVPLRVFAGVSGIKPDQFQAFGRFAKLEEMRPCPVTEWKTRFEAFLNRPIR